MKTFTILLCFTLSTFALCNGQNTSPKFYSVVSGLSKITHDPDSETVANRFYTALLTGNADVVRSTVPPDLYPPNSSLLQDWMNLGASPDTKEIDIETHLTVTFRGAPAYLLSARYIIENNNGKSGGTMLTLWFKDANGWQVIFLSDFPLTISIPNPQ